MILHYDHHRIKVTHDITFPIFKLQLFSAFLVPKISELQKTEIYISCSYFGGQSETNKDIIRILPSFE